MLTPQNKTTKGFTIIELLVTIVIIGIILSFIVVAFGDFGQTRQVAMQQNHLKDLIKLAKLRAIIEGKTYGLNISAQNYTFYQFEYEENSPYGHWQIIKNNLFKSTTLPSYTSMNYNHPVNKKSPEIIISPDGHITPFTLKLITKSQNSITLINETNGSLKIVQQGQ